MISQDHAFALCPQSRGQLLALFFAEDDATKVFIYGLCIAVEVAYVLIQHFQWLCKGTPRLACLSMTVARRVDVGSRLVYRRMYKEACCVCGPALIASYYLAVVIDKDHVRCLEETKMLSERVGPESVWILGISHTNVT